MCEALCPKKLILHGCLLRCFRSLHSPFLSLPARRSSESQCKSTGGSGPAHSIGRFPGGVVYSKERGPDLQTGDNSTSYGTGPRLGISDGERTRESQTR